MIIKRFIMTDIEKTTQQNMKIPPNTISNCITSWKVFEISSPFIMQNRLKNAMLGSRNRNEAQKTERPSIPKPIKKGSMLIAWRTIFGPACWIVLEKNEMLGECSMYLVTLTQQKKVPRPTNSCNEDKPT